VGWICKDVRALCEVDADLMNVAKDDFAEAVGELAMSNGSPALQLGRLADVGSSIRTSIDKRIKEKPLTVPADWRRLLDQHLAAQAPGTPDEFEEAARAEKTAALTELAEADCPY
jgi:hypothetical protein